MFDHSISNLNYSSTQQKSIFLSIALLVILIHLGLLVIGKYWDPTSHSQKPAQKLIVQTITLNGAQSNFIETETPLAINPTPLIETSSQPKNDVESTPETLLDVDPRVKEEIAIKEEIKKEEILTKQEELPILKEESLALQIQENQTPPIPQKPTQTSQPSSIVPNLKTQETKKTTPVKKTPPEKKSQSAPKKTPQKVVDTKSKPKATDGIEKKRQQEKNEAEKKRSRELEAEKARQQKRSEEDKKLQEEEKKRLQEKAAAQEAARKREEALLNKAQQNLAKMDETRYKINPSSSSLNLSKTILPKELGQLQVDALPIGEKGSVQEWGTKEITYTQEVASRLKAALKLPDYGSVKIKLTIENSGKVLKVEIIQSESSKNKTYVETKIPTLLFPAFGQRFQGVSQNTFVITLQNDS